MNHLNAPSRNWHSVCSRQDLIANSGVVALVNGVQVALFYVPDAGDQILYAVDNVDPRSGAPVIGRGLVGQCGGDLVIAAPLYKQHFRLGDGRCLEHPAQRLRIWDARLNGDSVEIATEIPIADHAECGMAPLH